MSDKHRIGVWDVSLDMEFGKEGIIKACETDAPTCVQVFRMHGGPGGPTANPHQSPQCTLCDMIENYAAEQWAPDTVTYSDKD